MDLTSYYGFKIAFRSSVEFNSYVVDGRLLLETRELNIKIAKLKCHGYFYISEYMAYLDRKGSVFCTLRHFHRWQYLNLLWVGV